VKISAYFHQLVKQFLRALKKAVVLHSFFSVRDTQLVLQRAADDGPR
jgi:hypothetical protein